MKRKVIPKLKKIINDAADDAKNIGDNVVTPEHIFLSILNDGNNGCTDALLNMGLNINQLHDELYLNITNNNLLPKVITSNDDVLPFSKETKKLFDLVDYESELLGDKHIDTTHILLSVLNVKNKFTLKDFLNNRGVDYKTFTKKIKEMRNITDEMRNNRNQGRDEIENPTPTPKNSVLVLDNFCTDITKLVDEGKIDPVIGRSKEIKRVIQILSRRKKNNPVIIGEAGTGKTSIAEGIALLLKSDNPPKSLINKRIYSLDLTSVVAGTKYRGQFEERVKTIIDELKNNKDIILFIDELHTFVGAGNTSGSLDASNIFKPALAKGEIQVIGATTIDEFREHIEKDGAMVRRFQQVLVEQTTVDETIAILRNIKSSYEKYHNVIYTDEAIEQCVKLSDKYITDRAMPDKAIDVLDEAGASKNVNDELPPNIKKLEEKRRVLLDKKTAIITQQRYEEAAEIRDEERKLNSEITRLKDIWLNSDKTIIVDIDTVVETVSNMTGIPITKVTTKDSEKLLSLEDKLNSKVIGQKHVIEKIVKAIKRGRLGIRDTNRPIASLMLLGNTGVGKSFLCKLLSDEIFGGVNNMVRIDMSEYMESHSVSKLIGSPPGYVGYEKGGKLTELVRKKPHSLILFDEIEKAHDDIFNLLLQILDEGHLTDSLGRKVNFKNTLIVLTSNVGAKDVTEHRKGVGFKTNNVHNNEQLRVDTIITKALNRKFNPEFINRLDDIIIFNNLTEDDIIKITDNELSNLKNRLKIAGYTLKINKGVSKLISDSSQTENFGARPIRRSIQRLIEDVIADEILNNNIKGSTITIKLNKNKDSIIVS